MKNKKCKRFLAFFSAALLIVALSVPVFAKMNITKLDELNGNSIILDTSVPVKSSIFINFTCSGVSYKRMYSSLDGLFYDDVLVYNAGEEVWVDEKYRTIYVDSFVSVDNESGWINFFNFCGTILPSLKSEILGHWRFNDKQISSFTSMASQNFEFENSIDGTKYTSMSVDPTSAPSVEPFSYLFGDTKVYDSVTGWNTPESKYITITNVDGIKDLNPLLDYLKANAVHSDVPFPPPPSIYAGVLDGVPEVNDSVNGVIGSTADTIVNTPLLLLFAVLLPVISISVGVLLRTKRQS